MVSMERDRLKRRTVFDRVPNGGDAQKDTSVRVFVYSTFIVRTL